MKAANLAPRPAECKPANWFGRKLRSDHIRHLIPGCTVRVTIDNTETGACEALYFELTKIKDGTYWGTTQTFYRVQGDLVGLPTGETMTFRKDHITEVPSGRYWQPKAYRKAVEHLPLAKVKEDEDDDDEGEDDD